MNARGQLGGWPVGHARRILRLSAVVLIVSLLGLIMAAQTSHAFNTYRDIFVTLSAKPLAMGGSGGAIGDAASVFYNPAGLADIRRFTLLYNHSARHFPGSREGGKQEWDQLDGDTEAIVVPLPLATFAHGFTFSGELGYDFRHHPANGSLGYPRERYWGSERIDALAWQTPLLVKLGVALRQSFGSFTPAPEDQHPVPWTRVGEGTQWGVQARIYPGVDYGQSELRLNYDWSVAGTNSGEPAFETLSSKQITKRQSYALHPTGWLTLAWDEVKEQYIFDRENELGLSSPIGFGTIHLGNHEAQRIHRGAELNLGNLLKLRSGDYDGSATLGCGVNFGGLWLNYSEAEELLPQIVGLGQGFGDLHIYGFDWIW